jgi:hypothetical protein
MRVRYVIPLVLAIVLALGVACSDDSGDGEEPASVEGIWTGTYTSDFSERAGDLCFDISQLTLLPTAIGGTVTFEGERPLGIGGAATSDTVSFNWVGVSSREQTPAPTAEGSTPAPEPERTFTDGGVFKGDIEGDTLSGTFESVNNDRGKWSAQRDSSRLSCDEA